MTEYPVPSPMNDLLQSGSTKTVFVLACGDLDAGNHGQVSVYLSLHYTQQLTQ